MTMPVVNREELESHLTTNELALWERIVPLADTHIGTALLVEAVLRESVDRRRPQARAAV